MSPRTGMCSLLCLLTVACHDADDAREHSESSGVNAEHDHAQPSGDVAEQDAGSPETAGKGGTDTVTSEGQLPNPDAPPAEQSGKRLFAVHFDVRAGDQPIRCGSHATLGTRQTPIQPVDLRFFVHDVALVRAQGERVPLELYQDERWQRENVALLDFVDDTGLCASGDPATREVVYGYAEPHDDYTGVAFNIGVPAAKNHLDGARAPAPYNASGLWWSWSGGYKYMRFELSSDAQPIWYFHLGAAGCSGVVANGFTCAANQIAKVELPDFNPLSSTVVFDLARFYAGSDLTVDDGLPGCMGGKGDEQCPPLFAALGIVPWDDAAKPPQQTAFVLAQGQPFDQPDSQGTTHTRAIDDPSAWPDADFVRPTALDIENVSKADEQRSHAPTDARYNVNCMRCHQEHGPGLGLFSAAGTVVDAEGQPATGARVEIFTGTPQGRDVMDFASQVMMEVDQNGNFFTTHELPTDQKLGARILDAGGKLLTQMPFTQPTTACNNCHTGGFRLTLP
jgi:uncharacterized repeat protein (TIGR04052 family)